MNLVSLAVTLIVLVAIAAIVYWFVKASGINIPKPLLIVIYAVIAIIAILVIAGFAGVGPAIRLG